MIPFLFITYSTGLKGHGYRYVSKLMSSIANRGEFYPVILCPQGFRDSLPKYFIDFEIVEVPDLDFRKMEASRFQVYGKLAPLVRGFVRRKLCQQLYNAMFRYLKDHPEIVLVHAEEYEYLHLANVWSILINKFPKIGKVVTVHLADFIPNGWSIPEIYKRFVRKRVRYIIEQTDAVNVHGRWIAESLPIQLKLESHLSNRIHVTQYGAESRDCRISREEARQKLGLPLKGPVALWFGMLRRDKRPDIAISATGYASQDLWLLLAGSCESVNQKQINDWVIKAGIEKRCVLQLGYVPEEDIPIYYSAADVFLTTHWEGYGATSGPLNDCRTYRLPAIVSDCGELGHYVRENGVGLLARPGDAIDFADKLNTFFDMPAEQRKIIDGNIEIAAKNYSWESMSLKLEQIYRSVLNQNGNKTQKNINYCALS